MLSPQKMYQLNKDATVLKFHDGAQDTVAKMNALLTAFLLKKGIDINDPAQMPSPEREIELIDELCDSQEFRDTDLEKEATRISNDQMLRLEEPRNVLFIQHLDANVTDSLVLMGGKLYQCRTKEIQEITDDVAADAA